MEWIFKMIEPIIKECETPQQAEDAIKQWSKSAHPRDAFAAIFAIEFINSHWDAYKSAAH